MGSSPLRVLLFTPSKGLAENSVKKPAYGIQSLGVLFVASALREWADFPVEVQVADGFTFALGQDEIEEAIVNFKPHIVGVSATTVRIYDGQKICAIAKSISPDIVTVVGGPHACSAPEDAARHPETDIVVVGEGEETFLEICRAVHQGSDWRGIEGTAYSRNGEVILNNARTLAQDLDALPWPDLGFLPPLKHYNPLPVWGKGGNFSTMITSRGCPYGCSYCSVYRVQGGKYRYQSAEGVLAQLQKLHDEWGVRNVIFKEGTFTRNRERVIDLCRLMIENNLDINWSCNGRVNELDPELLGYMKRAGCTCIQMGIEQGNTDLLWKYKKLRKEQVLTVLGEVRKAGIDAHGCFMLGMPEESAATIDETIEFARSLPLNTAFFNIFTPRPGTKIFEDCQAEGLIPRQEWNRLDDRRATWSHPHLSEGQLSAAKTRAYRRFYLRPSIVIDRIRHIRSWKDLSNHLMGTANFFLN